MCYPALYPTSALSHLLLQNFRKSLMCDSSHVVMLWEEWRKRGLVWHGTQRDSWQVHEWEVRGSENSELTGKCENKNGPQKCAESLQKAWKKEGLKSLSLNGIQDSMLNTWSHKLNWNWPVWMGTSETGLRASGTAIFRDTWEQRGMSQRLSTERCPQL